MTPEVYSGLKWGALFGGALGIVETLLYLLALQERNAANLDLANAVLMVPLEMILPLVAGFLATRESTSSRTGWIAGLVAGLIVAAINMTTELVYPIPAEMLTPETLAATQLDIILGTLLIRLQTIGFGAFFGWLGGRMATRITTPGDKGR